MSGARRSEPARSQGSEATDDGPLLSVILAAGPATRMRPLSYFLPKILLPVRGRPVLEYLKGCFSKVPISCHYVVVSEHREVVESYLEGAGVKDVRVVSGLGWETGGDLALALEQIRPEVDIVVANGDIVTDVDVSAIVKFHRQRRPLVTMGAFELTDPEEVKRFGRLEVDANGTVRRFVEKSEEAAKTPALVNNGLYVFDRRLVGPGRAKYFVPHVFKLEVELFPRLAAEGELVACRTTPTYWWDVGTMSSYLEAERFLTTTQSVIPP
jgi:NDP-sugar pyrophosphorylase family protein